MKANLLIFLSSTLYAAAITLGANWIGPVWDRFARQQIADLTPLLKSLTLEESKLPLYLRAWGLGIVALVLLCWLGGSLILAPPMVYMVIMLPRYLLRYQINRRRRLLRDQLVGATVALANTARAGQSLAQGMESVGGDTPDPLGREIRRIVQDYQRGRPLAEAITDTKSRLNLESFTVFASAILACLDRGGRLTDALMEISKSLQENQRLRAQARSRHGQRPARRLSARRVPLPVPGRLLRPGSGEHGAVVFDDHRANYPAARPDHGLREPVSGQEDHQLPNLNGILIAMRLPTLLAFLAPTSMQSLLLASTILLGLAVGLLVRALVGLVWRPLKR